MDVKLFLDWASEAYVALGGFGAQAHVMSFVWQIHSLNKEEFCHWEKPPPDFEDRVMWAWETSWPRSFNLNFALSPRWETLCVSPRGRPVLLVIQKCPQVLEDSSGKAEHGTSLMTASSLPPWGGGLVGQCPFSMRVVAAPELLTLYQHISFGGPEAPVNRVGCLLQCDTSPSGHGGGTGPSG